MKFIFIIILISFFYGKVNAQNLVRNGSFELQRKYFKSKKKLRNDVRSLKGNIDFFNTSNNPLGYQTPYDGDSYCGIILTSDYSNECASRDYIQLKLSEPLKAGYKYLFSLHINLANNSGYYTDQIGVAFSEKDVSKKESGLLSFIGKPSITNENNHFLEDTLKWVTFQKVYNATGGEQFIVVGNFQECNSSSRKALNPNIGDGVLKNMKRHNLVKQHKGVALGTVNRLAYYFVDNISVTQLKTNDSIAYLSSKSACTIIPPFFEKNKSNLIQDADFNLNENGLNAVWKNASKGTPDFADGYTGLYLYAHAAENNREYIISPLKQPLSPCNRYYFSFKIRRNPAYKFAVDNIGISLIDSFYHQDDRLIFPLIPDFQSPKFQVINNTRKWITICGEITPNNCAKYIVIGNFKSDQETYIMPSVASRRGGPYAHYFIDNIEIYQSDTIADCVLSCKPESDNALKLNPETILKTLFTDTLSIKFENASSTIQSIDPDVIAILKATLAENESLYISIEGHTNSDGKEKMNLLLSKKRAFNFYQLLVQNGFDPKRLSYHYYGEQFPIADNSTDVGKELNRRIDIYFVRKK